MRAINPLRWLHAGFLNLPSKCLLPITPCAKVDPEVLHFE